jgi:hypothetical protein
MNAPWTLPQKPGSAVFDEGAHFLKTLPLGARFGSGFEGGGGGGAPPQHYSVLCWKGCTPAIAEIRDNIFSAERN